MNRLSATSHNANFILVRIMRSCQPSNADVKVIENWRVKSGWVSNISHSSQTASERIHPRHTLPDDQSVDVVGALVSLYRFQIHHVSHERVLVRHAVRTQDISRHTGALERHPNIVSLGHGDVL